MNTRILVTGGRDFTDATFLNHVLDEFHAGTRGPVGLVIHGAAHGADSLAGAWAGRRGVPVKAYVAEWQNEGRAAGPIRNKRMLHEGKPDLVIAFPGVRGTANMVKQAERLKSFAAGIAPQVTC